jgi:hypothetical protein
MTTTTTELAACLDETCETCGVGSEVDASMHRGEGEPGTNHEFEPHTHSLKCSAAFWRLMGCEPVMVIGDGVEWPTYLRCASSEDLCHEARLHPLTSRRRPDILADSLGSPDSPEAWMAMKDVLKEIERRGWAWEADPVQFSIWENVKPDLALEPYDGESAGLPRAVALAAVRALSSQEAD